MNISNSLIRFLNSIWSIHSKHIFIQNLLYLVIICLYIATSQSGGEGQGDTFKYYGINRQTEIIVRTKRPLGIETTHPILILFIQIRIKLQLLCRE